MAKKYIICPFCKKEVEDEWGKTVFRIGEPFFECPNCKKTSLRKNVQEWETLNIFCKIWYFFELPLCFGGFGLLLLLFLRLLCGSQTFTILIVLLISCGNFLFWFIINAIISYYIIKESTARTKDIEYLKKLLEANFEEYKNKKQKNG